MLAAMPNPERAPLPDLDRDLVRAYANTFIARRDVYPVQRADGRYVSLKKRLTLGTVAAHLSGTITLGAYALDADSRAQWICLDADTSEHWAGVLTLARALQAQHITPYLERSRRGGHLWLFFAPLPGTDARRFGRTLLDTHNLAGVELFPKQDRLTTGPGSLVRLPLGIHRKTGRRYHFVTLDGEPLAPTIREQVRLLATPEQIPPAYIRAVIQNAAQAPDVFQAHLVVGEPQGETLSDRIKHAVSVYDFVSQFVTLNERGVGCCPFHDDQHQSFSVNPSGNFWHCFAGCGGGSIIDFWMKWREAHGETPDFVATVSELAKLLL
jgi:hypothetical protein